MMLVIRTFVFISLAAASIHAQVDQGISAFNQGRYSEALKLLSEADKTDERAQLFLAMTKAATGKCVDAVQTLVREPLNRLGGIVAVRCYSVMGDTTREFDLLEALKKRFPNDADVLYLSAHQHMEAFNDDTFAMFQRTPSSYRVHQLSAELFEVQNRYDEAVAEYKRAIQLNAVAPDLHFHLGRALLLQSHNPEALRAAADEFRLTLKLNPEDSSCEYQLGQIAEVESKGTEAKSHYENALKLSPSFVQALISLGKLEDNPQRAIELLKRAVALDPENEAAHYALLAAYRNSGQLEKAKAEKDLLDRLQKPANGEFTNFLKKLGEKPPQP